MNLRTKYEAVLTDYLVHAKITVRVVIVGAAVIAALALCLLWSLSQPKGRVSCADFGSYNDALRAYTAGATWLDHDSDGIPCEILFARDNPGPHGE